MTSLQEQKTLSRGNILMSRFENLQGFYSKWLRLEREFSFPNSLYYPFTLLLPFAHCYTFRIMFISKFEGVYFWLVYHVTPHMLHMITLRMKFSGAFMDNDFV